MLYLKNTEYICLYFPLPHHPTSLPPPPLLKMSSFFELLLILSYWIWTIQFSSRFLFKCFCKRRFIFGIFFHFYCISASLSLHFVLFLFFIPPRFNFLLLSANKTWFHLIQRETGMNKEQNTSLPKVQTSIGHFRTISSVLYEALGIWKHLSNQSANCSFTKHLSWVL